MFARVQLTLFQYRFRYWLGADNATSHCLNQCWLDYRCIYASIGLNELTMKLRMLRCVYKWKCLNWEMTYRNTYVTPYVVVNQMDFHCFYWRKLLTIWSQWAYFTEILFQINSSASWVMEGMHVFPITYCDVHTQLYREHYIFLYIYLFHLCVCECVVVSACVCMGVMRCTWLGFVGLWVGIQSACE